MPGLANRAGIEAFLNAHEPINEPTRYVVGEEVGVWKVVSFLGRGGNGEVYRVVHKQLGLIAALKVLIREDDAARDRFRREARILAEHSHPAFPRFLDYNENDDHAYLVIEVLEALPLPNEDRAVAKYLCKVCEGVSFLHGLGLVHRDIKPQNVLQRGDSGQPVLIDLGLVKDTTLSLAHTGVSLSIVDGKAMGVGTPKYAAPEQFAGGAISPAADIHALGMLANECFGGHPPRAWERIIRRSTSSIPSQRYATVDDFVRAIRARYTVSLLMVWAIPLAIVTLVATGWGAWSVAMKQSKKVMPAMVPKLEVTKNEVVSVVTNAQHQTNALIRSDKALESKKRAENPYPHSGAFSGDAGVDRNF